MKHHQRFFALSVIAIALLCSAFETSAQKKPERASLPNTEKLTIPSKKIGQTYDLLVSLPADYATSGKRYPVLYVLDSWHFPLMAYFQENGPDGAVSMPPVVIVTISHGDFPYETVVSPLRFRDFIPMPINQLPGSGHAAEFLDFFEKELIPFVDSTYRTDTNDRGLLGHSLGGLFALYAMHERPELFGRIVAASPTIVWDKDAMIKWVGEYKFAKPIRLSISVGGTKDGLIPASTFATMLEKAKIPNLASQFHIYEDENHESVRLRSFPVGLNFIYDLP